MTPSKLYLNFFSFSIQIASNTILDENQNEVNETNSIATEQQHQHNVRSEAAHRRREQLQKKLESFNMTFEQTTDFLTKIKTIRKS